MRGVHLRVRCRIIRCFRVEKMTLAPQYGNAVSKNTSGKDGVVNGRTNQRQKTTPRRAGRWFEWVRFQAPSGLLGKDLFVTSGIYVAALCQKSCAT